MAAGMPSLRPRFHHSGCFFPNPAYHKVRSQRITNGIALTPSRSPEPLSLALKALFLPAERHDIDHGCRLLGSQAPNITAKPSHHIDTICQLQCLKRTDYELITLHLRPIYIDQKFCLLSLMSNSQFFPKKILTISKSFDYNTTDLNTNNQKLF